MEYAAKLERLRADLHARGAAELGLHKHTSNLFRDRAARPDPKVDLSGFDRVVSVSPEESAVTCEAMATYADIVDATLAKGTMPCVVPQLKSITIGGAAAGVGIEASSFRYGLVHESLLAIDVLLADGTVVTCAPENEHRDLFFGFPNSYGTLGYALKVTARTIPVARHVRLQHIAHAESGAYFADLERQCRGDSDFIDGTVFAANQMYITIGRFVDTAPYRSDYTFERIYYRSIRERDSDYLSARDYIWRWDTDWFWCSKNVHAQNPIVRRLLGRRRLNSVTYARVMRWNSRWGVTRLLSRMRGVHPESVIQDVDIPIARAPEFLAFLMREIGILPVWVCPVRARDSTVQFPLYRLEPDTLYVNFGFWDVIEDRQPRPQGFHNRAVERKVVELGGIKSLYSDVYFAEDEFWSIYNKPAYDALKRRYDPQGVFRDLYSKCARAPATA
ncbi:MAG TPA: FAD-binding oxidoreductase [Casimicrobiaceae bacterium]|nr:FAD-binding oxidoreductase [Casimicrobiaceae bacterium]